jgi:glycerol-3-phosphate dehydrogenase (NAD(P)+)
MTQKTVTVLLLGHGETGHAMAHLLAPRRQVRIWRRRPPPGESPVDLVAEAARADVVLFCLPAPPHHEIAARLRPALRPDTLVVTLAKGLDAQARTAQEALCAALPEGQPCAVLYGPMIAEEIRADRAAFAAAGCAEGGVFARLRALFAGSALALEHDSDVTGLSWCAVMKNVYAPLFGMADELALGDNVRGWLAAQATREIAAIVKALGGQSATALGLSGVGDLITTATSRGSHHREIGRRLARGVSENLTGEGVHALEVMRSRPRFDPGPLALYRLIDNCLREPSRAAARFGAHLASLRAP